MMSVSCDIREAVYVCVCVCVRVRHSDTKFRYGAFNQAQLLRVGNTKGLRDTMRDPANVGAHMHFLLADTVRMLSK
jgi:hypothetical protein